ncbi:unnamed protein product [marine sediment metagenome]|uniref:NADH-ubiquinone oxidoreductase 51kDa subunit iron-sulphur binding domain-containing protein n=1 Tax=marine sediment metagenome TaxID=412755 RepID=X1SJQ0_9ZZZZ
MYESFKYLREKEANYDELKKIEELAEALKLVAFCPLGQSIASPVLSALKYFRAELSKEIDFNEDHETITREMNDIVFDYS